MHFNDTAILLTSFDNTFIINGYVSKRSTARYFARCFISRCIKFRRRSQQRRLLARDVIQRNSVLTNRYSLVCILHFVSAVVISYVCQRKKWQEIQISQNSSFIAATYVPQRRWINYTTNQTLHPQSIHCPLRRKWI